MTITKSHSKGKKPQQTLSTIRGKQLCKTTPTSKVNKTGRRKQEGGMGWVRGSLQYRCSLQKVFASFRGNRFREEHKLLMATTPFRHIFRSLLDDSIIKTKKVEKALDFIIKKYDEDKDAFQFGEVYGNVQKSDVKLIFGIQDGPEKIDFSKRVIHRSLFTDRLFPGTHKISGKMIQSKLLQICPLQDNTSVEDTVRLVCLLLVGTCFVPTTGTFITSGYFPLMNDIHNLNKYDWSGEIISMLKKSVKEKYTIPRKVTGCTLLLLYWFFERYNKFMPLNQNYPRCGRWDLKESSSRITVALLNGIQQPEFISEELQPTNDEVAYFGIMLDDDVNDLSDVALEQIGSQPDENENESNNKKENKVDEPYTPKAEEPQTHANENEEERQDEGTNEYCNNEKPHPRDSAVKDNESEKLRARTMNLEVMVRMLNKKVSTLKAKLADIQAKDEEHGKEDTQIDEDEDIQGTKGYVCQPRTTVGKKSEFKFLEGPLEVGSQLQIQQLQEEINELVEKNNKLSEKVKKLEDSEETFSKYADIVTQQYVDLQTVVVKMKDDQDLVLKTLKKLEQKDEQLEKLEVTNKELNKKLEELEGKIVDDVVRGIQTNVVEAKGTKEEDDFLDAIHKLTQQKRAAPTKLVHPPSNIKRVKKTGRQGHGQN